MTLATREQLLRAQQQKFVDVPCPEIGEDVVVRVGLWTGAQRDAFEAALSDRKELGTLRENARAVMVVHSALDEQGNRMFSDADLQVLSTLPWSLLDRIANASGKLNGVGPGQDEAAAKN
ncbi:MAG TPA: hypothetical protein VGF89_00945 [Steroidobacteraceae bacterium]|jgi:hypothetical protein